MGGMVKRKIDGWYGKKEMGELKKNV